MRVSILLFENFETLDVYGPVELFGRVPDHQYIIGFYSLTGGIIKNHHGVSVPTEKADSLMRGTDILLIPGGIGTRKEVDNAAFTKLIREIAEKSTFVLTVCTGSALLARTGLLDSKRATSNAIAFDWVVTQGKNVNWIRGVRWTVDGKFYTSAGVSAGMDMTLGFLADRHDLDFARNIARQIEYLWNEEVVINQ